MPGLFRASLAVSLLLCSFGVRTYALPQERVSPARRVAESEALRRENEIEKIANTRGISRTLAESEVTKARKAFDSGWAPKKPSKLKPPAFAAVLPARDKTRKIEVNDRLPRPVIFDLKDSLVPRAEVKTGLPGTKWLIDSSEDSSLDLPKLFRDLGHEKKAGEGVKREESGEEHEGHHHHADSGCDELQSLTAKEDCREDKKKRRAAESTR